jgi:ribonuclease G
LAEWFYESGIGEDRAILTGAGQIIEARIERHSGVKVGLVIQAQFVKQLVAGKRGIVRLDGDEEALLTPVPAGITEGASLKVEIVREAVSEQSRYKLPMAKAHDGPVRAAPALLEQIEASGYPVRQCHAHEPDVFENHGWGEVLDQARSGVVSFAEGSLQIAVTPAMTLIDIDGDTPAKPLCVAAAVAAAQAIRQLGLQGNIGIDFPALADKSDRQAVAEAFDAVFETACERTGINGFGFMQIVTRRIRSSLPELLQARRMSGHALELLRRAERATGTRLSSPNCLRTPIG